MYRKCSIGLVAFFITYSALANPVLNNVSAGKATIHQTPNSTVINQTSKKAILNWNSFNIGGNESTHFQQPAGGVALNRISPTQGASQIYGRLTATGQIILINPAGVYFGPGAYVNVGGLIATTANITDQNFLAGNYHFEKVPGYSGAIINEGQIIAAKNGLIALVAPAVMNKGMIQANVGKVVLASGEAFTMNFSGDNLINFSISEKTKARGRDKDGNELRDGVSNTGSIMANGGQVLITAQAASAVLDHMINMEGIAQVKSIAQNGKGEIILSGDTESGIVRIAGKLDASGKGASQKGGNVTVTGYNILLDEATNIDTSGVLGGGNIRIGGNYKGQGPLPNANATVMASGASLVADAITRGNGGEIILWADNVTKAYGNLSTRGGKLSGNGGFIETSGKNYLDVNGITVNTSAPKGKMGLWLLDPTDLTISNAATSNVSQSGGTFTADSNSTTSNLLNTTVQTQLATTNVTILTTSGGSGSGQGNITVNNGVTWSSNNTLTLSAYNNIVLNAALTNTTSTTGGLVLRANNEGAFDLGAGGAVTANTNFNIRGPVTIYYNPTSYSSPVTYTNTGTGAVTPYMYVNTAANLQSLSNTGGAWASNFALSNNIDATSITGWTPIGGNIPGGGFANFSGIFDGQNFTISNLTATASAGNLGVFDSTIGTIRNIGIVNPTFTNTSTTAGDSTGGLIGIMLGGTASNSYVSGGTITGFRALGGFVGYLNNGTISTSYSTANVVVTDNGLAAGGFVGLNSSTINTSYAGGTVTGGNSVNGVGGFVGNAGGTIANTYATGAVSCGTNCTNVGGFAGVGGGGGNSIATSYSSGAVTAGAGSTLGGFVAAPGIGTYTNNFWDSTTSGIATGSVSGITARTTTQMRTLATFTGWSITATPTNTATRPSGTWFIFAGDTRPILLMEQTATPVNAHQLQMMGSTLGGTYTLGGNIDLSSGMHNAGDVWATNQGVTGEGFTPVGYASTDTPSTPFSGSFNGNGYIIDNLYINLTSNTAVGLFGRITSATISNAIVTNASVTGLTNVGIVAGTINNAAGLVTNSYSSGAVFGPANSSNVGGLVGTINSAGGTISNSYSSANVTITGTGATEVGGLLGNSSSGIISNSYSLGTVTVPAGTTSVGGLIGRSTGAGASITNSYSMSQVVAPGSTSVGGFVGTNSTSSTISNSYATGYVTAVGSSNIGGFVGNNSATLSNSFWDTDTTGRSSGAGANTGTITNLTGGCFSGTCTNGGTANMSASATFSSAPYNWDFTTVWNIVAGQSYPYLRAFYTSTPRGLSGTSSTGAGVTVSLANNGSALSTTTGANGFFYFLAGDNLVSLINNTIADSSAMVFYLDGGATRSNVILSAPASSGGATGISLGTANTLGIGNGTTATIANSDLAAAIGSISDTDILYTASGNDITIGNATNTTVNLTTTATTTLNINGSIAPTGGGSGSYTFSGPVTLAGNVTSAGTQAYNGAVTLGANATVNSGNNTITFGSTVTGASNTLSLQDAASTGGVTFNDNVTLGGLTTFAGGYGVVFNGSSNTFTNAVSFLNTNGVTLGNGSDVFTFNGGLTSTAGTTTINGTVTTSDDLLSLAAVSLGGDSTLASGSGAINISGAVSGASNTLALQADTAGSTGAVTFSGNVTLAGLTTFARAYAVNFNGGSNTFTNAVTFNNTNGVTLGNGGDAFTFNGGLTSTAGTTTLGGAIATSNDAISLGAVSLAADSSLLAGSQTIGISGAVSGASNTLAIQDAAATGNVTFGGNVTLAGLTTFAGAYGVILNGSTNTFTNAVSFLNTNGVTLGNGGDVFTFNGGLTSTAGTTTLGGAIATSNDAISLAAVSLAADSSLLSGSATTTISGTVTGGSNTLALQDAASTGDVTFSDNVTLAGLTTFAGAYGVNLNGGTNTFTNAVSFLNTNGVTLGNGGDAFTFNGGLTSTASTTTLGGTIATSNDPLTLGTFALASDSTLTSGSGAISLGTVNAAARTLTLQDNTAGSTGGVTFNNDVTLAGLTTFGQAYAVTLNGANNIFTNAVTFLNTNGVTLGNGGDAFTFNGGLTSTAGTTTLGGAIATSNDAISLGAVSLAADSSLLAGSQTIGISGAVSGASNTLAIQDAAATGNVTFDGNVTLAGLTTFAGAYGVTLNGGTNTFTNAVSFLNTNGVTLGNGGDTFTFNGGLTSTASTTTLGGTIATSNDPLTLGTFALASDSTLSSGSGAISLGAVNDAARTLTLQDNTGSSTGAVTFNNNVTLAGLTTFGQAYAVTLNGGSNTFSNAVTFNNTNGVTLGNGGDAFNFNGGLTSTASTTTLNSSISTSNDLVSLGSTILAGSSSINSGSGAISIGSITGANSLILTSSTGSTLNGAINVASLTLGGGGTDTINSNSITTTASQVYGSALDIDNDTLFSSDANITFNDTVNGSGNLTIESDGTTTFNQAVGATSLASLVVNGGNTVINGGAITTVGSQTYNNEVTLGAATALNGSDIALNDGVVGNQNLNVTANNINMDGTLALNNVAIAGSGGSASFALDTGSAQTWSFTGVDTGSLSSTAGVTGTFGFSNIENITGGSAADSFTLNGGSVSGSLDGGAGDNTLAANNVANVWNVTGSNSGDVTGVTNFSNIQNLSGNMNNDQFNLAGGTISGNINGSGGTNELAANNTTNTWNLSGSNAGTVTGVGGSFSNIQNLTGGSDNDSFIFANNANIAGTIDGGSLAATNTLNYLAYSTAVDVTLSATNDGLVENLGSSVASFTNINNLLGNSASSNSITMPNAKVNTVVVTGAREGYINDPIFFNGFTLFNSLSQTDQVQFTVPAQVNATTGTVVVNGVVMTFSGFDFGIPPTPVPGGSSSSSSTVSNVAQIIQQPDTNASSGSSQWVLGNDVNQNIDNMVADITKQFDDLSRVKINPYCYTSSN